MSVLGSSFISRRWYPMDVIIKVRRTLSLFLHQIFKPYTWDKASVMTLLCVHLRTKSSSLKRDHTCHSQPWHCQPVSIRPISQVCLQSFQRAQGLLLQPLPSSQLSQWGLQLIRKLQKGRRGERQLQIPPTVTTRDDTRADHDSNQCRRESSTARVTGESYSHLRALGLRD